MRILKLQFWGLTCGVDVLPSTFSQLEFHISVTQGFPSAVWVLDVGQLTAYTHMGPSVSEILCLPFKSEISVLPFPRD